MDANFLLWSVKFLKKNKKILILQKLDHCGRAAKIRSFSNPIKVVFLIGLQLKVMDTK